MMRGQPLAAFGAATLNHKPASFSAHTNTKAMSLGATAVIGLKSSLHDLSPYYISCVKC